MQTFKIPDGQEHVFAYEHAGHYCVMLAADTGEYEARGAEHEPLVAGQDLETWLRSRPSYTPHSFTLTQCNLEAGQYHPRIWRPGIEPLEYIQSDEKVQTQGVTAFLVLNDYLQALFRTVEPDSANDATYGHEIRSLLMLATTEVEAQLTGILKANNYISTDRMLRTSDYIKLRDPMLLEGYEVGLSRYRDYPPFKPFAGWNDQSSTKSLPWWHAYNKTKHDREHYFCKARFGYVIQSVGAVLVMLYAQNCGYSGSWPEWRELISPHFSIQCASRFPPEDYYIAHHPEAGVKPVWTAEDCPL